MISPQGLLIKYLGVPPVVQKLKHPDQRLLLKAIDISNIDLIGKPVINKIGKRRVIGQSGQDEKTFKYPLIGLKREEKTFKPLFKKDIVFLLHSLIKPLQYSPVFFINYTVGLYFQQRMTERQSGFFQIMDNRVSAKMHQIAVSKRLLPVCT